MRTARRPVLRGRFAHVGAAPPPAVGGGGGAAHSDFDALFDVLGMEFRDGGYQKPKASADEVSAAMRAKQRRRRGHADAVLPETRALLQRTFFDACNDDLVELLRAYGSSVTDIGELRGLVAQ